MKFTLDWLKDHLDTNASADQIAEALTTIGLEVESVTDTAKTLKPFVVAHVPPAVTVKVVGMEGEQALLEAQATDPLVRLSAASFSVNGKPWVNLFPTDGLFDSKAEQFRFKTDALRPGTYVVVVRVRDAAGNTGSADVVFNVQTKAESK